MLNPTCERHCLSCFYFRVVISTTPMKADDLSKAFMLFVFTASTGTNVHIICLNQEGTLYHIHVQMDCLNTENANKTRNKRVKFTTTLVIWIVSRVSNVSNVPSSVAKSKGLYTCVLHLLANKISKLSISNADIIKDKLQVSRLKQ